MRDYGSSLGSNSYRPAHFGDMVMTPIPERILEEAYRLAKASIFHGGVDWAAGDIAKALAAAEQRGREMEREECGKLICEWDSPSALQLAAGEMTAQESRTVRAVLRGALARIRSRSEGKGE